MYFQNKYKEYTKKDTEIKSIVSDFDYILNNMWCTYSFAKGKSRWLVVGKKVAYPYNMKISTEIGHVENGHGKEQALMALRTEMTKYIDSLI